MKPDGRLLLPLFLLILAVPAFADVEVEIRYGHGKQVVAGAITPLSVRITSRESQPLAVAIETTPGSHLGAGEVCRTTDTVSPGGTKEFTFHYRPYSRTRPKIKVVFDRDVLVTRPTSAGSEPVESLLLEPPPTPPGRASESLSTFTLLAVGTHAARLPAGPSGIRVVPVDEAHLPEVWHSYDGIDAVLLRNPAEENPIDPGRIRALLRYVEMGGRLIVFTRRPGTIRDTALERALPADIEAGAPRKMTRTRLAVAFRPRRTRDKAPTATAINVYRLLPRPGTQVVLRDVDDSEPIVVEKPWGFGTIRVVAFDPSRFPELGSASALYFYSLLVNGVLPPETSDLDDYAEVAFPTEGALFSSEQGDDPVGEILRLLRAGALRPPPMGLLFLFMILYILAVGPLDYWILKRHNLLKWSALSFLGLAILFSVVAWFVSFHLFAGESRINRVTFVDVMPDPDDGPDHLLVQDLAGYYAPRGDRMTLDPKGETSHVSDLVSFDSYSGGGGLRRDPVQLTTTGAATVTADLTIPFRSLRTVRTVLYREALFPVEVERNDDGGFLVRNGLDYPLHDVRIIDGQGAFFFGTIEANSYAEHSRGPERFRYELISEPFADEAQAPSDRQVREIGQRLASLSYSFAGLGVSGDANWTRHFRPLEKSYLDRSPMLLSGGTLLVGWTDAKNPLGLPGDSDVGFSITVIRKVIRP